MDRFSIQRSSQITSQNFSCLTKEYFNQLLIGIINEHTSRGLFLALDENSDGLIDFKEYVCGLSALCKGPENDRIKFMSYIWEFNKTGFIAKDTIPLIYKQLNVVFY